MSIRGKIFATLTVVVLLISTGCDDNKATEPHFVDDNWTSANIKAGGQLYDKWWKVTDAAEPTGDFDPIWSEQSTNTRTGADTWRCKECHGWDYIGLDGRYSSGSHYTGFEGLTDASAMDPADIFDAIKGDGSRHDFASVLDDTSIMNLAKFVADGLTDMYLYIDSNGLATGDATAGATLYTDNCAVCHGADGNTIDFEAEDGNQGVGWLAVDNPQEVLHKIFWGNPGSQMPSMISEGLTRDQCGDILAYAQSLEIYATLNWGLADIVAGGQLYDKWWKVNGGTEPTTDFDPIWSTQTTNARTGADTWRCKECHGWDYIGLDGRYSSGSHYTGFDGVMTLSGGDPDAIFNSIKSAGGDHDFSAVLSNDDVLNLTKFIVDGLFDMYDYIDPTTYAGNGDATNGATLYGNNCAVCHGADGNTIDFDDDDGSQGVGWLANDNPQEVFHKIRWGHPGSSPEMPSMISEGLTDAETGDVLTYCQSL